VTCSAMQCDAVCYSVVQRGAVHCCVMQSKCTCASEDSHWQCGAVWCIMMQCAAWCSVMQHDAVWCIMVQHGAVW